MAGIYDTRAKRRWSAGLMTGVIVTATIALGTFGGTAGAEERRGERGEGWEHRRHWDRDYYRAPPVVYSSPYYQPYYAPTPFYGPGIGLNFNFR